MHTKKAKIGISSCLLGNEVRYNAGHCHNKFITQKLSEYFDYHAFCPEVEMGLGIPRPTLRLVQYSAEGLRLEAPKTEEDYTELMNSFAQGKVETLAKQGLSGMILKKDSPSCALFRCKVYSEKGHPIERRAGLFAEALKKRFPTMPMEEEGRLNDHRLKENFIYRVFAYQDWQETKKEQKIHVLYKFHARHKYRLMAHNQNVVRELGKLLASHQEKSFSETCVQYEQSFFTTLTKPATRANHANALSHIMGYFSKKISSAERQDLAKLIEDYRQDLLPLIVPVIRLRHYLNLYHDQYLQEQVYLYPHPSELKLLNQI